MKPLIPLTIVCLVLMTSPARATSLHQAAATGTWSTIVSLLTRGANPNARDEAGHTPLHLAATRFEQAMIIEELLANGADPNATANDGSTPLHYAAGMARNIAVRELLAHGANPNAPDEDGNTPLHYFAAEWRITEQAGRAGLSIYAAAGAGIAVTGGRTARATGLLMSIAALASQGHNRKKVTWTVQHLFRSNTDFTATNDAGETPHDVAERLGHASLARELDITQIVTRLFVDAVTAGDLAALDQALSHGADPNALLPGGRQERPLELAARTGHLEIVKALIAAGVDVNANGGRALVIAAEYGNHDLIEPILNAGADVNARGRDEMTALHFATAQGNEAAVNVLVKAAANVNVANRQNHRPVHYAAAGANPRIVQAIVEAGADVNAPGADGSTPLDLAVMQRLGRDRPRHIKMNIAHPLLAKGADPTRHGGLRLPWASRLGSPIEYTKATNQRDLNALLVRYRGKRPRVEPRTDPVEIRRLAQAVERGDTRTIAEIIRSATIAEVKDDNGFTMLCLAARNNQRIVMDTLFGAGTDVNARNEDGSTAGHCGVKHTEIMRELVRRGLDVEATDHAGATVLHWAARAGAIETGYLLIEAGARVETKDRSGTTPLDWATRAGQDFFRLLIEQAAHSRRQRQ